MRRNTLFHSPNASGRARHGEPARTTLGYLDVEGPLAEREIETSYESSRPRALKSETLAARKLRRPRP